ncbi:hypothetical protein DSO57_1003665 [Entomophthora muscae]|uniref:Uncharacterized protein n=1 Tax=Entomophthora muscae TaxID=34485 RepID=A0ACC2T8B0_9FUNG|nr:hypothetical protein DSO57_1003665 [Entomophthora muscae]
MNVLFSLLVAGLSLQASLVNLINRERVEAGVAPVVDQPIIGDFIKRFLASKEIAKFFAQSTDVSDDVCQFFPRNHECTGYSAADALGDPKVIIISASYNKAISKETKSFKDLDVSWYKYVGNITDPFYKTAGEHVERDKHYVVLTPYTLSTKPAFPPNKD